MLFLQQRRGRHTIIDTCKFYLWNLGAPKNIDVSIYSSPRLGVISTVSSFDNKMTTHRSPCRWHLMIHLGLKQPTYGIMVYSSRICEHYDLVGDPKVCSWPNFLISHLCLDTPLQTTTPHSTGVLLEKMKYVLDTDPSCDPCQTLQKIIKFK